MRGFGTVAIGARVGKPDPRWVQCWTHLVMSAGEGDKILPLACDLPHHFAASTLMNDFLTRTDCDTLLLVDDDMDFSADDLSSLRDHDRNWAYSILSALYCSRHGSHEPIPTRDTIAAGGTVDAPHVGFGFTLIRRACVEHIFAATMEGELPVRWSPKIIGEDVDFCRRAIGLGHRVGVDTTVPVGHRSVVTVTWDASENEPAYRTNVSNSWLKLAQKLEGK